MSDPLAIIIEDHDHTATIFAAAVKTAGYSPEIISNGEQAINYLPQVDPALIVLDLHLPHVSGEKILKFIRGNEKLKKVRVILATADPLLAEILSSDANLVLIKPISFDQLSELAKRLHPSY
ncbi:MAG: response regulator [Ardenticatenaceae bacterium]|nr:response regulator [Ardenticatenaceae bacterium]MCB9446460.1 response regulator [Ardenticatenaceae bacterium]